MIVDVIDEEVVLDRRARAQQSLAARIQENEERLAAERAAAAEAVEADQVGEENV